MAWTLWSVDRAQAVVAQAYRTLRLWQAGYPDEYVHACYHYGKQRVRRNEAKSKKVKKVHSGSLLST